MKTIRTLLMLVAGLALCQVSHAGGDCCHHCGCTSGCRKVCRLVCETKETTKVTYECKCEDFCVPGPSSRCKDCSCSECDGCCKKTFSWIPGCASLFTKKVLVKKEEKVKKPTYKWVVEDLCPSCARCAEQTAP